MSKPKQEIDEQEMLVKVATQKREIATEELFHLTRVVEIAENCKENHIVPLVGVLRSFARFTNSEDNVKILRLFKELMLSYDYNDKSKMPSVRKNITTIIETLDARIVDIEECERESKEFDFHFDFYPLLRYYYLVLVNGHKQMNDEREYCKQLLDLVGTIARREAEVCQTAIHTCDKILH